LPAHATVLGHALLADQTLAQLRALYPDAALPAQGPQTPTDAVALFERVQQVRTRGHVISEGFYEAHISTVAAPVFGEGNHVVAAIGLNVPGSRVPEEQRARLVAAVRGAAAELSTLLNYAEDPGPAANEPSDKPRAVALARRQA
jgi:DNA-binding IclR family transcriptional regulator